MDSPKSPGTKSHRLAASSGGGGVRDCLAPCLDRKRAFEEEFKERIYQSTRLKPLGRPTQRSQGLPSDPGFAFGVSTHETTSVKTLLCPSTATTVHDKFPRPRRHSQGLRIPPTYVFGRGRHEGQYKGGASDGVASALAYVDGGAASSHPTRHQQQHQAYDQTRIYGLRSRRDEEGTMKACLQYAATAAGQHDDAASNEPREPDRQLASATGRTRGMMAEPTTAQLLAPDAVGLDATAEYLEPRSKDDLRRIFLQRLGPQSGLDSEEAFEGVFARAVKAKAGGDGDCCSIQAFCAAL